jgi:glycosyltransferase involved in cell wall biosynthesis
LEAALIKPLLGYKLFTGSHTTASVFPLANREISPFDIEYLRAFILRTISGRFISLLTEKCYGATNDCADVATRFFGVEKRKIDMCPLGVDTDVFCPITNDSEKKRVEFRERFGFSKSDIVCIYTGRFSEDKNPLILAKALENLNRRGEPYRALFIGNGAQGEAIHKLPGCVVHPFVPVNELGDYFRAADIGVWPTQESTSDSCQ